VSVFIHYGSQVMERGIHNARFRRLAADSVLGEWNPARYQRIDSRKAHRFGC
jgi:hypothetical protein